MTEHKSKYIIKTVRTSILHPVYFIYCIFCGMKTLVKMASSFARYGIWTTGEKRFVKGDRIRAGKYRFSSPDLLSFYFLWEEIFEKQKIYEFKCSRIKPVIIDAGANIGCSVIFFKDRFPSSVIEAYEADPQICEYLKKNLAENKIDDVNVHNEAVWVEDTVLHFQQEGADGGHLENASAESMTTQRSVVEVKAKDFRKILEKYEYIDFLKMDIEGAENEVIPHLDGVLEHVEHIFIEYHQFKHSPGALVRILDVLERSSFQYVIKGGHDHVSPFITPCTHEEFLLQLEIYAWREQQQPGDSR